MEPADESLTSVDFDDFDGESGRAFVVDKPITRERVDVFPTGRAAAQNEQKARKKRRNEQFLQLLQR
ncbi:MAG: hypothetical protein IJO06_03800 [Thermoguttaceae bacterium]|nr:hypothetical protein [Thermoguttaceae bacterium]MBQ7110325.1 hypothetical protein [Thermoguttaceae bacterium]